MKIRNRIKRYGAVIGGSVAGVFGVAGLAAATTSTLPSGVTTAYTTLGSNVSDLAAETWPLITAVVSALILMKLFKRFTSKA